MKVYDKLKIADKISKASELEKEVANPEIWHNVELATQKNQELARLSDEAQPWQLLGTQIKDLGELISISDCEDVELTEFDDERLRFLEIVRGE